MIGERKFTVIQDGVRYTLSDGKTTLDFLSPENLDGITNEELVGLLLHRLRWLSKQHQTKCTSRAITKLEEVEEVLWRFSIEKALNRERQRMEVAA